MSTTTADGAAAPSTAAKAKTTPVYRMVMPKHICP
ncbi:hypothetical protein GGQ76_002793 [Aureimonas jatrophae]|uniref:Uncharacterized protein n=1 Tax=Aureimonas jatrophae TaxID=1166073 RepID=A0A1H0JB89_9HYPH|nr:hypothetical protein [Aureimonas jatrophae]SDO41007.1 hypothetical protein SAMN05192530_106100 [Aureimonas jatrophae]